MTRFKRILKKIAQAFLVLVLAMLVINSLLHFYWGKQIENRLAAIKAAGQPVSVADLQGKPVPVEDNAAPVYEQAFKLLAKPERRPDIDALNKILYSPIPTPNPQDWAAAKAAFTRSADILELIDNAQSKPACQFPLQFDSQEVLFQRLGDIRGITRLLCASAVLNAREGNTQKVFAYIKSAFRVDDAVGKDSVIIIDYLCGSAITKITLANLRQALHYCQLSESELRDMDNALSRIDSSKLYRHAMEGERVFGLQQMARFAKRPFSDLDTLAYLDFTKEQIAGATMTYSSATLAGLIGPDAKYQVPSNAILTRIIVPVFQRANLSRYRTDAEIACGRVFLALQAYKGKFGRYPQSLTELKSGIDWKLPTDPFSGKNLIYKPKHKGFILYSVGPDQKDDGGIKQSSNQQMIPRGDIAWKIDH